MATLIQIRRGTAAEWASANPILAAGELALSTDIGKIKVGNGSSNWSSLSYITPSNSDDLSEGSTNLYFSNARAVSATEATIASASAAALAAANSYADSLDTDDIAEGSNLYFTNQRAIDATLASIVSASAAAVASANGYTDAQISSVIDAAPGALDTLNELAAALGDDANFATTITNSIATKLSISDASATYLTQADAATTYDAIGSAAAAQSAATGYADSIISGLDTDDIAEGSNLYFTNQRALDATAATIASASAAAVAHADALETDDVAEGSTNLYFTNQRALDATAATIASASAAAVSSANSYTDGAISNLVDSAPAALDTLNELAAALGDDANFATTVTNSLSAKAPLNSPTFTGTVVLPSTTSIGNVSSTELGYLDGVTSAIQTQINSKAGTSSPTFTGTVSASVITATSIINGLLFKPGYTTTVTSGSTVTLTVSSSQTQFFTGSSNQNINLPVTSTLSLGHYYDIHNTSSATISVRSSGSNTIGNIPANASARLTCILTSGTTAASWNFRIIGTSSVTGTGSAVFSNNAIISNAYLSSATANTPSPLDNSTKVATTEYVDAATALAGPALHPMFIIGGV